MTTTRLLILSFSPIARDARVLKQVRLFADRYDVTTCGFGPRPATAARHIELPTLDPSRIDGRLITLRQYWLAYWTNPAIRGAREKLRGPRFDIVLANDIEAVPLALSLKPRLGVHADLHEYYPALHEDLPAWRRRISPYMSWLCRRYGARAASHTTVSGGLQTAYRDTFGFEPVLVPNAAPFADERPTPVHSPLRLVHHGGCQRNRHLEVTLQAVRSANADVTLDLFLTANDPAHLAELKEEFESTRIRFHDPVPYARLIATLNDYDVGVHVLAPTSRNNLWALPNKLFDYVQARLGVLVGPSPEMARVVQDHHNGAVVSGFESADLKGAIESLDVSQVWEWKQASDRSAEKLSAEHLCQGWSEAIDRLAERDSQ